MPKPKLLIALSRMPYPATDGTRYKLLANVSDALKDEYAIEYFIVTLEKPSRDTIAYLEQSYGPVHLFPISRAQFFVNSLRSLWNGKPFQTNGYLLARAATWLSKHIEAYAAVYAHTVRMASYFEALPEDVRAHVLMEFNDAISLNYREAKRRASFPLSAVYAIEEKRIRHYEAVLLERFPHANVVSPNDRAYLLNLIPEERRARVGLACIPHGVPTPAVHARPSGHRAYFIGQLGYEMNKDALFCLLGDIWPKVRARVPDAELSVIGKGSTAPFHEYASVPGVTFHGFVQDPAELISTASCLAAPLRAGAGMPSKIIEALSYGVPVITTPLGARGVPEARDSQNMRIIPADDAQAWAEAIVRCMTDADYAVRLGAGGHELFKKTYELSEVQDAWRALFARIKRGAGE